MDKENLAPPPEVGDKGRRPYDRADVRTNKEVPRSWRAMAAQAGLAEISCPQGPTFGEHKIDGWPASPGIQEIAEEQHPINTRAHRHCSDHQAAVAAVPLWKINTTTPVVEEEAKPDPVTTYQFLIGCSLTV
ncbi:hypothetical protein CYMTET_6148 [Cymbomonas tetramitiformis]|uniref:Uncharacterized protein n=1 Tax=Cymbomonas tetramitiformis TaxID=36881 RepID=A0AAE0LIC9_9CHLO|nr:hypothetical protein CYMTET_6148 [Cymbomonas tetramitiformis]